MPTRVPTSARGRVQAALRRHTVWLSSALLVGLMVAAAIGIGQASLHAAKEGRLQERISLLQKLLEYYEGTADPAALAATAARAPFDPQDAATDRRLLASFMTSATGDPITSAALVRTDGSPVAIRPSSATPPTPEQLGAAWKSASSGTPARSDLFFYDGKPAVSIAIPIGAADQWGVLMVTQQASTSSSQRFVHDLGSLGRGSGGVSLLDRNGYTVASWDPALLGTQQASPASITSLSEGTVRRTSAGSGALQTTGIMFRRGDSVSIFRQPTKELFADLESGQRERDRALIAVLVLALVGVLTTSVRRLRAARRNGARMHALLSGAHDLILVVGDNGRLTFISPNLTSLLGYAPNDWTGRQLTDFVHPDDIPRLERLVADPEAVTRAHDVRLLNPAGGYSWFDIQAGDVSDEKLLTGVLLTCREAGQRKDLEDKLLEQARRDPLTGLANRAVLNREIETLLAGSPEPRFAVLFIDLDGFKQVNDEQGHEAGDALLITVGTRLRLLSRESLAVARFGGDEFVVVAADADPADATTLAEDIVRTLSEPVQLGGGISVRIGASVGIAVAGPGVTSSTALVRVADRAMYEAKRSGGGIRCADPLWLLDGVEEALDEVRSDYSDTSHPGTDGRPVGGLPAQRRRSPRAPSSDRSETKGLPAAARPARRLATDAGTGVALVATILAIIAVAGIGLWGAVQSQQTAERQRIGERLDVTARVADYASAPASPERLLAPINAAPSALDGSLVDDLVLSAVLKSGLGGSRAQAALYRSDGKLLVGKAGTAVTAVSPGSEPFAVATRGAVGLVPYQSIAGLKYDAYAIPITRGGRIAAVLSIAQLLSESTSQHLLELLGSLGFGEGGVSSVLADGTVTHSWNPRLIGTKIAGPEQLARARQGRPVQIMASNDDVTLDAYLTIPSAGYPGLHKHIVLQQPNSTFYAGIRDSGLERNLALLGGVLLCLLVVGLGGIQRNRQELRAQRRLNALLRNAHDIVMVTHEGRIGFVSSAIEPLLGSAPEHYAGAWIVDLVHPDDRARATTFLAGKAGDTLREVRLLRHDGEPAWFDLHRTDLSADEALRGVVLTCQEIGEGKQLRDQLAYLVQHDQLTGLPNRSSILERLEAELAAPATTGPRTGCWVLFIDLDRFKPINDTFGHEAGDAVLRSIASRLSECIREIPGALAGRLGGDEFAVLMSGGSTEEATVLADRILRTVSEPITLWTADGQVVSVGATVGVAQSAPGDSPASVMRRADEAMYTGKHAGRGRYAINSG